jgi:hypothetical protein
MQCGIAYVVDYLHLLRDSSRKQIHARGIRFTAALKTLFAFLLSKMILIRCLERSFFFTLPCLSVAVPSSWGSFGADFKML